MVEKFEGQTKGRQILFVNCTLVIAIERLADNCIDFALHRQQLLFRSGTANFRSRFKNFIALVRSLVSLIAI